MTEPRDGFWLPRRVRESVLSPDTEYETMSMAGGRPCAPGGAGAVTVRWPRLAPGQWAAVLAALHEARLRAPRGQELWRRLQAGLAAVGRRLADPGDPLRAQALTTLPGYTGYSEPMIRFVLGALGMMSLEQLPAAFALAPMRRAAREWQAMPGLPGRVRFAPEGAWWPLGEGKPLFVGRPRVVPLPSTVIGYGSGNVPGTALLIALLSLATTLAGGLPPAVLVKNSRREPIFAPIVLAGLEAVDPELVGSVGLLVWDYEDGAVQEVLLGRADLVLAAASDATIAQIAAAIARVAPLPARFCGTDAEGNYGPPRGAFPTAVRTNPPGGPYLASGRGTARGSVSTPTGTR